MKKILNIFASISLITATASSVVACGSTQQSPPPKPKPNPTPKPFEPSIDQNVVNDITHRLQNQSYLLHEIRSGSKNFGDYETKVLQDMQKNLKPEEKNLISFPTSDQQKQLDIKTIKIDVHIQSHSIMNDVNINVRLKKDAQSIADEIGGNKITLLQNDGYHQQDKVSNHWDEMEAQLLTPIEVRDGFRISKTSLENKYVYWPYWDEKTKTEVDKNVLILIQIEIGKDTAWTTVHLEFDNYQQKEVLDNPYQASEANPIKIKSSTAEQWNDGDCIDNLNTAWEKLGGLPYNLESYVVYEQVLQPGEKNQPITKTKPIECKLYFKDSTFGYSQDNPRDFWVQGTS